MNHFEHANRTNNRQCIPFAFQNEGAASDEGER
jgi:hypothetical protein